MKLSLEWFDAENQTDQNDMIGVFLFFDEHVTCTILNANVNFKNQTIFFHYSKCFFCMSEMHWNVFIKSCLNHKVIKAQIPWIIYFLFANVHRHSWCKFRSSDFANKFSKIRQSSPDMNHCPSIYFRLFYSLFSILIVAHEKKLAFYCEWNRNDGTCGFMAIYKRLLYDLWFKQKWST